MDFQQAQAQFMAHIRDPENNPKPADIEDRRMGIYRELFFNNINGFLQNGFPVLHSLYNQPQWHKLVRAFFATHHASSPYFLDISKEFVQFLAEQYQPTEYDPPFMQELAHYEWVELAVATSQTPPTQRVIDSEAQAITVQTLYLSHAAQVVSYHFAVHTISKTHQPQQPSDTPHYMCVYRDSADEVQFLALNAMTALLLQTLADAPAIQFADLCQQLQQHAPQFTSEQIATGAQQIVTDLAARQIVVTHAEASPQKV